MKARLSEILERLGKQHGASEPPPARGPFELVLWENACYLLPDTRRREVFEGLRHQVGLTADAILAADRDVLLSLAKRGGMRPEVRVFRWLEIARVCRDQYGGDLSCILARPYAEARKALKQFPTIGDPGAEKILMYCGVAEGLPLESNGLRVLTRFGYGREYVKNYGRTYRSVQDAVAGELPKSAAKLTEAHILLRQHGKEICKSTGPLCYQCSIATNCQYPAKTARSFLRKEPESRTKE
jgi:endonuclease III